MDSQWRKSTRSGSNGACVEARCVDQAVEIRDSKNAAGPVLRFDGQSWSAFLRTLKR
ncbi:DUF397 domain-containing protein [Micromonospora fiedleri]|uniref:DUF397 domain-containing protein n=1 Tax=Micromonospora fiedleri TaxID=1157498 RepID=A0ABS1UEE3_9ACTN|nr:DUF397 domain-containing protein [Micromonospora fiedleri]MBL6274717.1 DUF397 domain-containing protein [Micromonospora fiedleri]